MSNQCLALTNKGHQCSNSSAYGYYTCNIKSHIEQLYETKKTNSQQGGGWGGVIEPISSLKKTKKLVQMGGGWGQKQASFFGLFGSK